MIPYWYTAALVQSLWQSLHIYMFMPSGQNWKYKQQLRKNWVFARNDNIYIVNEQSKMMWLTWPYSDRYNDKLTTREVWLHGIKMCTWTHKQLVGRIRFHHLQIPSVDMHNYYFISLHHCLVRILLLINMMYWIIFWPQNTCFLIRFTFKCFDQSTLW